MGTTCLFKVMADGDLYGV